MAKLSEEVVVKFGFGISAEEVGNQRRALELLDPTIIRIPRVYRYFTDPTENDNGGQPELFLVTEYIHGEIIESLGNEQMDQLARVLSYFSTIHGESPGPLKGGVSHGLLWQDNGKPAFRTVRQMERWLNIKLPDVETKLDIQSYPLVFCHLDLAPRNILWLDDGSICLLDCESTGLYPRFFEICMLKIVEHRHSDYETALLARTEKMTGGEEAQMLLLYRSFHNGIRYSFVSLLVYP